MAVWLPKRIWLVVTEYNIDIKFLNQEYLNGVDILLVLFIIHDLPFQQVLFVDAKFLTDNVSIANDG